MPVGFLSDQQVARFGRFAADPSPAELELFFRLDAGALQLLRRKRRDENRLGFAVQLGTVRMLGTFLEEDQAAVPAAVTEFVAEQLGIPSSAILSSTPSAPATCPAARRNAGSDCSFALLLNRSAFASSLVAINRSNRSSASSTASTSSWRTVASSVAARRVALSSRNAGAFAPSPYRASAATFAGGTSGNTSAPAPRSLISAARSSAP